MEDIILYKQLGMATLCGLLVGMGRSWSRERLSQNTPARPGHPGRAEKSTKDIAEGWAGIRTFTLIGLFGGLAALVSLYTAQWVAGVLLATFILLMAVVYFRFASKRRDWGTTTLIAALITFALGILSFHIDLVVIASITALMVVILETKQWQHKTLTKIQASEFSAFLKLLVLAIILLPLLPNQGYGPVHVLNPQEIGLMVAIISAITFFGHFAIRIFGTRTGPLLMGVFGGLASSTALTVSAARIARHHPALSRALAGGISMAIAVMLLRTTILLSIISLPLMTALLPVFIGGIAASLILAVILYYLSPAPTTNNTAGPTLEISPPSDMATALEFGIILALVLLLSYYASHYFGDTGLYAVAVISGFVDVDAVTITAARMSGQLAPAHNLIQNINPFYISILLAITANNFTKLAISLTLGGRGIAKWVACIITVLITGMLLGHLLGHLLA